jgi:hypothetical protein
VIVSTSKKRDQPADAPAETPGEGRPTRGFSTLQDVSAVLSELRGHRLSGKEVSAALRALDELAGVLGVPQAKAPREGFQNLVSEARRLASRYAALRDDRIVAIAVRTFLDLPMSCDRFVVLDTLAERLRTSPAADPSPDDTPRN